MQNFKLIGLELIFLLFVGAAACLFSRSKKIGISGIRLFLINKDNPGRMGTTLYFALLTIWTSTENPPFIYISFILLTSWIIPILNNPDSFAARRFRPIMLHSPCTHIYSQQYYRYNRYSTLESTSKIAYKMQDVHLEQQALCTKDRRLSIDKTPNLIVKRSFDIVVSLVVLLFILSWLTPLLALIIKLDSGGPVFFVQLRSGKNGTPFKCYKFRSMYVNDTADLVQAHKNDKRLTPIGLFLRRTSIDELPQFWNVLRSEMSVIGPRPHMLLHTKSYQQLLSNYTVRLSIKPGITGWAQVNNCRGETKQLSQMAQRVSYDIFYLKNWSIGFDLQIAVKTVRILLSKQQDNY